MPNKFYDPGTDRAAKVQHLFSTIAPRYDLINDLQSFGLHRSWKRRMCELAAATSSSHVLDLCCGTGDLVLQFARSGAQVVGLDFNEAMLRLARARADAVGLTPEFVKGDALQLPFPDSQFDIVTVSYGLRNLADIERGLGEMWRVAKPGGRLLVLDFGKPRQRFLRAAYFAYLQFWVPLFGRLLCGDPATYAYILESLRHYPGQETVKTLMLKLGCHNAQVVDLLGGTMAINYADKPARAQDCTPALTFP